MSEARMNNLDVKCAELGQKIARIRDVDEKVINATLSVLEEQGLYAMFLYLQARHSNVADRINPEALEFLRDIFNEQLEGTNNILEAVRKLSDSENLDDVLFARDLLRTGLSYARYHLKAKGGRAS